MKIKTSEATGPVLDYLVAKCAGVNVRLDRVQGPVISNVLGWFHYRPSADWSQGGPIIEREKLWLQPEVGHEETAGAWYCVALTSHGIYGPTPLVAAMRCYVASKLGEEVEVPEELI